MHVCNGVELGVEEDDAVPDRCGLGTLDTGVDTHTHSYFLLINILTRGLDQPPTFVFASRLHAVRI